MNLKHLMLGVGGLLAIAAPSCAVSAPTATGTYVACYKTSGGAVRFTNEADGCDPGEQQATWNQTGPAGPAGINGNGPVYTRTVASAVADPGVWTDVNTLALPAGDYAVDFAVNVFRGSSGDSRVTCDSITPGMTGLFGEATSATGINNSVTLSMNGTFRTAAPANLTVRCSVYDGAVPPVNSYSLYRPTLTATKVTQVIDQS